MTTPRRLPATFILPAPASPAPPPPHPLTPPPRPAPSFILLAPPHRPTPHPSPWPGPGTATNWPRVVNGGRAAPPTGAGVVVRFDGPTAVNPTMNGNFTVGRFTIDRP